MSTRAFITGVSGTGLTAAERALGCANLTWDFSPFRRSVGIPAQATGLATELAAAGLIAGNPAARSIPVDGAAEPAHLATTSATMMAQVIRRAIGFQGLLMSHDVPMNALAGSFVEPIRAGFTAGCETMLHSNDNATSGAPIAPAGTASA
jgi:hypothetical protein